MRIKTIIIDDEPLARKGLREYVADTDFLELVGEFDAPLKSTEIITQHAVQLILLDIQMPRMTGIEFFKSLNNPPPVIFTTAFPQYALDGFELNALDYLVKPISFERFFKSVLKAKEFYEIREKNQQEAGADYFFIKTDSKIVRINFSEIVFVEALQNYVCIYTKDKKYISYLTFKSVSQYLPASHFIQTHKSFIVAAAKIDSIEGNNIKLAGHEVPISRAMKEDVMEQLLKGKFLKR